MHRKLTEGLADAWKVDKRSQGCWVSWLKLTDGPRMRGKLKEVDRKSHRRTELTEGPAATPTRD